MIDLEQISDGVWSATMASPADRNALGAEMRSELLGALKDARARGAKVIIIRGDQRAFSSGYKLDPGVMRPTTLMEDRSRLVEVAEFMRDFRALSVVTIAEVRGYCVAGGTDLMLASDIAIVADNASIGVPNVRGLGITMLLPVWSWMVGPQRAKLLALTGDFMTGVEAADYGLVAASFPENVLEERTTALAERVALMPVEMLEVTKQALNVAWDSAGFSTTLLRAAELDALSHGTTPVVTFWDQVESGGLRDALAARDGRFAGGRMLDHVRRA